MENDKLMGLRTVRRALVYTFYRANHHLGMGTSNTPSVFILLGDRIIMAFINIPCSV